MFNCCRFILDRLFPCKDDTVHDYLPCEPDTPSNYPEGFLTDGCSGGMSKFWRKVLKRIPPWEECCLKHDLAYWRGGYWYDRKRADSDLYYCVRANGHPIWAILMYYSVRIGGSPILPFPWRWGYGWSYVGRYEKRNPEEKVNSDSSESQ